MPILRPEDGMIWAEINSFFFFFYGAALYSQYAICNVIELCLLFCYNLLK